jgi:23S rRNA (uracil1939-C5)-methyltransferase
MKRPKSCTGIDKPLLKNICFLIRSHKPVEKILLFGSRARRDFRVVSDIDIAVFAKNWTQQDVNLAKAALEETIKTPLTFDLVNYYLVEKPSLKRRILKEGKVLYGT